MPVNPISTVQSGNNQVGRVPSEFTAGASKLAWGRWMRVKGGLRESHVSAESERAGRGRRGWGVGRREDEGEGGKGGKREGEGATWAEREGVHGTDGRKDKKDIRCVGATKCPVSETERSCAFKKIPLHFFILVKYTKQNPTS